MGSSIGALPADSEIIGPCAHSSSPFSGSWRCLPWRNRRASRASCGRLTSRNAAWARLSAYYTDLDGHPIAATLRHSELLSSSAADKDNWQLLDVELSAAPEQAAYLVMELGLLQPLMYAPPTLGERTLHGQDIRG